jgi:hypothetical protein
MGCERAAFAEQPFDEAAERAVRSAHHWPFQKGLALSQWLSRPWSSLFVVMRPLFFSAF